MVSFMKKVLVIAPHPDDEVLGCGGIIAKNINENNEVYVCVVTKGVEPLFSEEDEASDRRQCLEVHKYLGIKDTFFLDLPAAMLSGVPTYQLNGKIAEAINAVKPDELYIPFKGDMHLDHKLIADACMVACRPRSDKPIKKVYAYETLSETGWDTPTPENTFIPNVYVDISEYLDTKVKAMEKYSNQIMEYPSPRSAEGIKALAMYRGSTVNKKYAESFMLIREIDY